MEAAPTGEGGKRYPPKSTASCEGHCAEQPPPHLVGSLSHELLGRLLPDGGHGDHPADGISLGQGRALVLQLLPGKKQRVTPPVGAWELSVKGEEATRGEHDTRDLYSVWGGIEGLCSCDGAGRPGSGAGVPYLHGVLLEEAECVGKHLQCLHFLPVDSF